MIDLRGSCDDHKKRSTGALRSDALQCHVQVKAHQVGSFPPSFLKVGSEVNRDDDRLVLSSSNQLEREKGLAFLKAVRVVEIDGVDHILEICNNFFGHFPRLKRWNCALSDVIAALDVVVHDTLMGVQGVSLWIQDRFGLFTLAQ
jgi:hypothetical protein